MTDEKKHDTDERTASGTLAVAGDSAATFVGASSPVARYDDPESGFDEAVYADDEPGLGVCDVVVCGVDDDRGFRCDDPRSLCDDPNSVLAE